MKQLNSQKTIDKESKLRDADMDFLAPTSIRIQMIKDSRVQSKDVEEYISSKNKV